MPAIRRSIAEEVDGEWNLKELIIYKKNQQTDKQTNQNVETKYEKRKENTPAIGGSIDCH